MSLRAKRSTLNVQVFTAPSAPRCSTEHVGVLLLLHSLHIPLGMEQMEHGDQGAALSYLQIFTNR